MCAQTFDENDICMTKASDHSKTLIAFLQSLGWIAFSIYMCCIILVMSCTIYIYCKLTCVRKYLPWANSDIKQKIYQRSAIMVVLVCIISILSEAINATLAFPKPLGGIGISIDGENSLLFTLIRFKMIILEVGYGLKFFVYLIMSENFRHAFNYMFCKNSTRSK